MDPLRTEKPFAEGTAVSRSCKYVQTIEVEVHIHIVLVTLLRLSFLGFIDHKPLTMPTGVGMKEKRCHSA
jgi:hypothetical protein